MAETKKMEIVMFRNKTDAQSTSVELNYMGLKVRTEDLNHLQGDFDVFLQLAKLAECLSMKYQELLNRQ